MTTTTADLNLRTGAGTDNDVILTIPKGTEVSITGDPWYPVTVSGKSGWVSGKYLDLDGVPVTPTQTPHERYVAKLMPLTERMLGLWYHYGENFTQEPFAAKRGDCSGFVGWTADQCGYRPGDRSLYDYSADQMFDNFRTGKWKAEAIKEGDEQPGDIVFYGTGTNAGHVVVVIGKGRVRGASHGYQKTKTDAAAKKLNPPACVCDDDLHFHAHPVIGIFRPDYQ